RHLENRRLGFTNKLSDALRLLPTTNHLREVCLQLLLVGRAFRRPLSLSSLDLGNASGFSTAYLLRLEFLEDLRTPEGGIAEGVFELRSPVLPATVARGPLAER